MKRLLVLSLLLFLTGCAQDKPDVAHFNSQDVAQACSSNTYLKKFNCSADQLQQAAEQGDPDAQYALGYMYYYGIGIVRNPETARLWINKAAMQGQPLAQKAARIMGVDGGAVQMAGSSVTNANSSSGFDGSQSTSNNLSAENFVASQTGYAAVQQDTRLHTRYPQKAKLQSIRPAKKKLIGSALSKSAKGYTIQLMASYDKASLQAFSQRFDLTKHARIIRTRYHGRPWFALLYGQYQEKSTALAALKGLPSSARKQGAWVKPLQVIRQEVLQQRVFS